MIDLRPCPLCGSRNLSHNLLALPPFRKVRCADCGCSAALTSWQNPSLRRLGCPPPPPAPPPAQVSLDGPVEALEDASLAAVLRSAQALVKASVDALQARGFSVWASPVHERHSHRDTYFPDTEFFFRIKKSRVVETEKEL